MTDQDTPRRDAVLLVAGLLGVMGNVVAVLLLGDQPHAYRLAGLDAWAVEIAAYRGAAAASAITFSVGLLALAVWSLELRKHLTTHAARSGCLVAAMGALGNAFGTLTPLVLALHVAASEQREAAQLVSRALLGITLSLDALFNLTLGVGLLLIALGLPAHVGRLLRGLCVLAGLASIPVGAQCVSDSAASLLIVSGPLWLAFITAISLGKWVPHAQRAA